MNKKSSNTLVLYIASAQHWPLRLT